MSIVYLAGKIARHDWRHTIVDGLDQWEELAAPGVTGGWSDNEPTWPVLRRAAKGHDYAGPYFANESWATDMEDSHGVDANDLTGGHGIVGKATGSKWYFETERYQEFILERCRNAIMRADVVFAWFEEPRPTCYGTLLELGMAVAYNRHIILAGFSHDDFSGLWLAKAAARTSGGCIIHEGASALEAFVATMPTPRIDYYEYIQSPEWKAKADAAKTRAGGRCQVCNTDERLNAHHRTYIHLGNEQADDITVLCHACHELYELNRKAQRQRESER